MEMRERAGIPARFFLLQSISACIAHSLRLKLRAAGLRDFPRFT
jgi:hypothetical protein